jgi:hypothetical protein
MGESEPEVTVPPSCTDIPGRGMPLSSMTKAASFSSGPSSFCRRSTSTPVNSLSSAQAQPSPASIGVRSGVMSLP